MAEHIVRKSEDFQFEVPGEFSTRSAGYRRDPIVNESAGAVQMGFAVARLEPKGRVETHVHSFEESLYVVDGELTLDTPEGSYRLVAGDYALIPVGMTHALRNMSGSVASFSEMKAPLPRERYGYDTQFPSPLNVSEPMAIDVRDPRNRYFGHIDPENMDPTLQTQDRLALSASMRTALLVYSGISVKMMVDSDLGADLSTMFMVQYEQGGFAGAHDHPLEEAYQILAGDVEATFDGETYELKPGDVVRWLETQAPQPPPRHSYRFARDWSYLETALAESAGPDS
jgi:quercetin dioxygenase-like cupin family protein